MAHIAKETARTLVLPFKAQRNFLNWLLKLRLCFRNFVDVLKNRHIIALCLREILLETPRIYARTFKRTFARKFARTKNEIRAFRLHYFCTILYIFLVCSQNPRVHFAKVPKRFSLILGTIIHSVSCIEMMMMILQIKKLLSIKLSFNPLWTRVRYIGHLWWLQYLGQQRSCILPNRLPQPLFVFIVPVAFILVNLPVSGGLFPKNFRLSIDNNVWTPCQRVIESTYFERSCQLFWWKLRYSMTSH